MVEKLTALGKPVSWERVKEIAGEASIGRPHVALAMVEAGHVQTTNEAFDLYIGRNGPAYVEREKMTPIEAVQTLKRFGAWRCWRIRRSSRMPRRCCASRSPPGRGHGGVLRRTTPPRCKHSCRRAAAWHPTIGGSDYHALTA
jgi:hypothetical protein